MERQAKYLGLVQVYKLTKEEVEGLQIDKLDQMLEQFWKINHDGSATITLTILDILFGRKGEIFNSIFHEGCL